MYSSKTKAQHTKVDRYAGILFSLLGVVLVVAGLLYIASGFQGALDELNTTLDNAGQVIGKCTTN